MVQNPSLSNCQLMLSSNENLLSIRDLNATNISRLVRIPGKYFSAKLQS